MHNDGSRAEPLMSQPSRVTRRRFSDKLTIE
jgi:hypothetical protein